MTFEQGDICINKVMQSAVSKKRFESVAVRGLFHAGKIGNLACDFAGVHMVRSMACFG